MASHPLFAATALLAPLLLTPVENLVAQDAGTPAQPEVRFAKPVIDEESFGMLRGDDSNAFTVFSKQRARWSNYQFADHLQVRPWASGEFGPNASHAIIGFQYENGPITELVAVDTRGRFRKHVLEDPLDRELTPVLMGHAVLYYIADGTIYAFSGVTGTWGSIKAPSVPDVKWKEDGSGVPPDAQEDGFDTETIDGILVKTPRGTMKFAADVGVWQLAEDATPAPF